MVEVAQGVGVLPVAFRSRCLHEGEQIRRVRVAAFQFLYQTHGFGLDTHREPGTGLAATVGQQIAVQVAAAHVGNVDEGDAAQHEEQHKELARLFQAAGCGKGLLQLAEYLFVEGPLHCDPGAGIDAFEKPRAEGGPPFVDGPVIDGPEHAHVSGNSIPVEHAF